MAKSSSAVLSRVIPISALLLVVLFKFQNCAPAPDMVQDFDGTGEVRIIDRWAEQKVSFLTPNLIVASDAPKVDVQGLCVGSLKGQLINYQVIELNESAEIIGGGQVECVMGGFELPLAQIHFSSCSSRLQVRATRDGDTSGFAETVLVPDCAGS
ncbi:MAG: hypothetical protein KDD38_04095 [Bdellovibrionales bacterium]|nr:hypothetical protein [Bdellovibrionales bacterium]